MTNVVLDAFVGHGECVYGIVTENRNGTSPVDYGVRLRFLSWPTLVIGIVLIRAVLPLVEKPDSLLLSFGPTSYFVLLLLATGFAIRNGAHGACGCFEFSGAWPLKGDLSSFIRRVHALSSAVAKQSPVPGFRLSRLRYVDPRQLLDHQQFCDPAEKATEIDDRKPSLQKHTPQLLAVGKTLKAFGDVAIDFMIAVQKHTPQSCPYLQTPVFHSLRDIRPGFGEIEKGRYSARF
jgi:hypothetical protein